MDDHLDRGVKFGSSLRSRSTTEDVSIVKHNKKRNTDIPLVEICSDASDCPRNNRLGEVCTVNHGDAGTGPLATSAEEYHKRRQQENREFEENALSSIESLAPFKLKWIYGWSPSVKTINLTGLYKNHIAYAASNVLVIYDFVGNEQNCLQGHKNTITCLDIDKHNRFFASADSGYKSLLIIWDVMTAKALKFFPEPHQGRGCIAVSFTSFENIICTMGYEEPGKQTICLWDFTPSKRLKVPILVGSLPQCSDTLRNLCFDDARPEFFAVTGDKSIVFCTWLRDEEEGQSIFCYKPRIRKNFSQTYKRYTNSLWMREGKWLVTATMSGLLCVWAPPIVLGLESPPDPKKNIRDLKRYYRLSDEGLTYFTVYKEYAVVGDEQGVVRFFDHELKLLRWTKNFFVGGITSLSFNLSEEIPHFKKTLRSNYDREDPSALKRAKGSRVRDYSFGGVKDKDLSQTTITRGVLQCTDFVCATATGEIYYHHIKEGKSDLLVTGTPAAFVTCDYCPGSNAVVFCTRKGQIHVYDFSTNHKLFSAQIFTGQPKITTMKFQPTGLFVCFGLADGNLTFRRSFSWKTFCPPVKVSPSPVLRLIFSDDGLLLSYFTNDRLIVVLKYLSKARYFVSLGKCRTHRMDIADVQFFFDPATGKNRLFSLGLDRYLVEYDLDNCNPGDPKGLRVLKIIRLEETCQPTAFVFDGPKELGHDCITFSNTLNKLRLFQYSQERVRGTFCGPVFGREHAINRMIALPAKMSSTRFKKFVIFVRGNKLGVMDTPLDGNPHKYMAVLTHPGPICEIAVAPNKQQIFTIGHLDNCAIQWEASLRSVEACVIMGGSGMAPFYHNLRRNWGGACQDIIKDIDLIFFFMNLKRVDTQTDIFNITRSIRISELPAVCRACGYYPSEYEVELMIDEARRIRMIDQQYTDDYTTEFSFEDFIKLFSNHYYRVTESEIQDAFSVLGFEEKEEPYMCRSDFVYFLSSEGESLDADDFPIYFESMYLDQMETVFSDVQCHVQQNVSSSGSDTGPSGDSKTVEQVASEAGTSFSSSSSSTKTGGSTPSSSQDGEDVRDSGEDDEEEEKDGSDSDDSEEAEEDRKAKEAEKEAKKKEAREKKRKEEKAVQQEADTQLENDDNDDDKDQNEQEQQEDAEEMDVDGDFDVQIDSKEQDQVTEESDSYETIMDLPEKIELSFFLEKMLPPTSQQAIRWTPELKTKRKDTIVREDVRMRKRCQEYYDSLMKQLVDPEFPIHRKMLNALWAEWFMEHGDFDVPEELKYPGYGLVEEGTWFADDDAKESDESQLGEQLEAEDEEEEMEGKRKKKKQQLEDETEEEDESIFGGVFSKDGEHLGVLGEAGEGGDGGLGRVGMQIYAGFNIEYPGEDDSAIYPQFNPRSDEDEDASVFSAPFSVSVDEDHGNEGEEHEETGIVPGYNSDNPEYASDVENVYEGEDAAFIKEVNESFRPEIEDDQEEE